MKIKDIIIAISLIVLCVLTRTVFHVGENVEFVTAASLAAGYFMVNKKLSFVVPLGIMLVSDVIIGNTIIYIFTWSGFFVSTMLGIGFSGKNPLKLKNEFLKNALTGEGLGIVSTLIFYLWTNLGVVITSNMYEKSISGLMLSYVNALPFLANQLYSNMILVPIMFLLVTSASYLKAEKAELSLKAK